METLSRLLQRFFTRRQEEVEVEYIEDKVLCRIHWRPEVRLNSLLGRFGLDRNGAPSRDAAREQASSRQISGHTATLWLLHHLRSPPCCDSLGIANATIGVEPLESRLRPQFEQEHALPELVDCKADYLERSWRTYQSGGKCLHWPIAASYVLQNRLRYCLPFVNSFPSLLPPSW